MTMIVIRIRCQPIDPSPLYLFKSIPHNFFIKKRRAIINFDGSQKVKVIECKKEVVINDRIEFVSINHNGKHYNLIFDRDSFEKFFNFIQKYQDAYNKAKNELTIINWSKIKTSLPINRKCYNVIKFPRLKKCVEIMTTELLDDNDTFTRTFFRKRDIDYERRTNDTILIKPNKKKDINYILKVLQDLFVETHYLHRKGIAGEVETV